MCSTPDQTSRFMTAETGRFNRPLKCIYWGMRPLSACQLTGAPVCWPSTGRCKKQLAGNHVRMVILLVPMFSATTFRLFVCFCITDTLALFPLVPAPLKREFNLNGNQTELQRHSKHSAYTGTTCRLMLFSEIIGDFSNEPNGIQCIKPLFWQIK